MLKSFNAKTNDLLQLFLKMKINFLILLHKKGWINQNNFGRIKY